MLATTLVTVAFAVLSDALPQNAPAAAPKGAAPAGLSSLIPLVSGMGGLVGLNSVQQAGLISFLNGTSTGDLRGLAEFLQFPDFPATFMGGLLNFLDPLFKVPEIRKYAPIYLDWRNASTIPFLAPMASGPIPTGCSQYELLVARGTGELGTYGFVVGDPLLNRVQQALPGVNGYSVQYPANLAVNSSRIGAADVIARLQKQSKACPQQKFAIVGYSQGSTVMRLALSDPSKVGPEVFSKIVGGAMFGDPAGRPKDNPTPIPSFLPNFDPSPFAGDLDNKVIINCAPGDPVCTSNSINVITHLTYNNPDTQHMPRSAAWIVSRLKGEPVPPSAPPTAAPAAAPKVAPKGAPKM